MVLKLGMYFDGIMNLMPLHKDKTQQCMRNRIDRHYQFINSRTALHADEKTGAPNFGALQPLHRSMVAL